MVLRTPFYVIVILPKDRPHIAIALRVRDDNEQFADWLGDLAVREGHEAWTITGFDGSQLRPSLQLSGRVVIWIGGL